MNQTIQSKRVSIVSSSRSKQPLKSFQSADKRLSPVVQTPLNQLLLRVQQSERSERERERNRKRVFGSGQRLSSSKASSSSTLGEASYSHDYLDIAVTRSPNTYDRMIYNEMLCFKFSLVFRSVWRKDLPFRDLFSPK